MTLFLHKFWDKLSSCSLLMLHVCARMISHFVSDSVWLYGLEPIRPLCLWNSPGKNAELVAMLSPSGDLPDPGIEPASLKSRASAGRFLTTSATFVLLVNSFLPSSGRWYLSVEKPMSSGQNFGGSFKPCSVPLSLQENHHRCVVIQLLLMKSLPINGS